MSPVYNCANEINAIINLNSNAKGGQSEEHHVMPMVCGGAIGG